MTRRRQLSHGVSRTPEYRAWQTMRHRCTQRTSPAWPRYGGRGITICAEWMEDPAAFIAHVGMRPTRRHEIDRIDNDGNYEPGNVRWVVRKVNDRNRRSNRVLEWRGQRSTVAEWSELTGISSTTIIQRLAMGWSVDAALATPVRPKRALGSRKADDRHACLDCARPVRGARCITCSNKHRAAIANVGEMLDVEREASAA